MKLNEIFDGPVNMGLPTDHCGDCTEIVVPFDVDGNEYHVNLLIYENFDAVIEEYHSTGSIDEELVRQRYDVSDGPIMEVSFDAIGEDRPSSLRVFSSVTHIVKKYVHKYRVGYLLFTPSYPELANIYHGMIKRLAPRSTTVDLSNDNILVEL